MKKSNVKNLALVSFMTFVGLSFAACSSSDDGEGGSASGNPDGTSLSRMCLNYVVYNVA